MSALAKWEEYKGPVPEGLSSIPDFDPARPKETMGESDSHWLVKRRTSDGGMKLYISEKPAVTGLGRRVGLGGNTQLGMQQGDAQIVQDTYAETAAGGWTSTDPNPNASDVYDLITPGGDVSGINDTVYAQFKDPPNAQLWKYEPANGAGYFTAPATQSALFPLAQLVNGAPPATPVPQPPTPTPTPGTTTTMSTTTKYVLIGGGVLAVGALAAWALGYFGKHGSGSGSGSRKHASHKHASHRHHAHAPRRRRSR